MVTIEYIHCSLACLVFVE